MSNNPYTFERVDKSINYILSKNRKLGVLSRMTSDLLDEINLLGDVQPLVRLLESNDADAQNLGLSVLHSIGPPLNCKLEHHVMKLLHHEIPSIRKYAEDILRDCGNK